MTVLTSPKTEKPFLARYTTCLPVPLPKSRTVLPPLCLSIWTILGISL